PAGVPGPLVTANRRWLACARSPPANLPSPLRGEDHPNASVQGAAAFAGRQGHDGIKIEIRDLWNLLDKPGDAQKHVLDCGHVGGSVAAIAFQQSVASNVVNH